MAHITKIKASSGPDPEASAQPPQAPVKQKPSKTPAKQLAKPKPELKPPAKSQPKGLAKSTSRPSAKSDSKQHFILFRPFIALGRYLKGSWQEIRQVRWPSRGATWKMFLAVLAYAALFLVLIVLLDAFFQWIFNIILNKGV